MTVALCGLLCLGALAAMPLPTAEAQGSGPSAAESYLSAGWSAPADAQGRLFGLKRLRVIVASYRSAAAQEALIAILDAVRSYASRAPAADDLTLVVIKRGA